MRAHSYEVQKGNQVPATFVGKTVTWNKAVTIGEALGLDANATAAVEELIAKSGRAANPHFENGAALVAAAEQQRDISVREDIRDELSRKNDAGALVGTLEIAAKLANELTIGAPRGDGKVSKKAKPETQQKRTAASMGNRIFERAAKEPTWKQLMVDNGAIDLAEFDAWVAAGHAAEAAKAEAATPKPLDDQPAEVIKAAGAEPPKPEVVRRPGGKK